MDTSFERALIVVRQAERVPQEPLSQNRLPREELFNALVVFLPISIDKSCFAQDHHEELRQVVCDCYFDLCLHCAKRRKRGLVDSWFGSAAFRRM